MTPRKSRDPDAITLPDARDVRDIGDSGQRRGLLVKLDGYRSDTQEFIDNRG
jgi:hypothetical protein